MFRSRALPAFGSVLVAAFCLASVFAQGLGSVKGKVRAMRGDNISGATITARQGTKDIKSVKSGDKGDFLLSGLESGTYNIIFDARGYSTGLKSGVEIKPNQTVDLGDRLYLQTDQGTQVIVRGSVFYKDGTSVRETEVKVERVGADGSIKKIGTILTNLYGEFTFRQPEGAAKFRMTVRHKGETASKEIQVDSAAVYRLAISLNTTREK